MHGRASKKRKSKRLTSADGEISDKKFDKRIREKRGKLTRVEDETTSDGLTAAKLSSLGAVRTLERDLSAFSMDDSAYDSDVTEDSSASIFSEISIADREVDSTVMRAALEEISEHFSDVFSKDETVRLEGYGCLNHALCERVCDDWLTESGRLDELCTAICSSLKRGQPTEFCIAAKCASLCAMSLQTSSHLMYAELKAILERTANGGGDGDARAHPKTRIAAIDCLAALLWSAELSAAESKHAIDMFNELWLSEEHSAPVRCAALRAFAWMLCTMSEAGIAVLVDVYYGELVGLLEDSDANLIATAGESIALLVWAMRAVSGDKFMDDENMADFEDMDFEFETVDAEELREMFVAVRDATDHKKRGGPAKKLLKHKFKELTKYLDGEWAPKVSIKLRASLFELDGWRTMLMYRRVKEILGGGLQTHLLFNTKCQEWFEISDIAYASQSLSTIERSKKKAAFTSADRRRKDDRKAKRKSKEQFRFADI